jgi:hypothetical protein
MSSETATSAPSERRLRGGASWWRLAFRIPESLAWRAVLATVALVVTALLVPALTRQWQDRQKARDVKGALVVDMSTALSTALSTAQTLNHETPSRTTRDQYFTELTTWRSSNAAISGRLETYMPDVARQWNLLASGVDKTYRLVAGQPPAVRGNLIHALRQDIRKLSAVGTLATKPWLTERQWGRLALDENCTKPGNGKAPHPRATQCFATAYAALVSQLNKAGDNTVQILLQGGVSGYTTSFEDALADDI